MKQPLLSIQIPYTEERIDDVKKLIAEFTRQVDHIGANDLVAFEYDTTGKEMTIGEKRNKLYSCASGIYAVQWDSDDFISDNGLSEIIYALKNNPDVDCCTYEEHIDIDGKIQRSNHSLRYGDWYDNFDSFDYVRTPFMKSVIKTEIAKKIPVPHIRYGEDHEWSKLLKPNLKSEIHIDSQIYRYIHRSSDFNTRYGINQ